MTRLNPLSAEDRRITAYTQYFVIETFPNGDMLLGHLSFDCWGNKQHGVKKIRMTAEGAKLHLGFHNYVTLKLMKRGCCPPQLASQMLGDEDSPGARGDAIEEAYKLHKRGYLGGDG